MAVAYSDAKSSSKNHPASTETIETFGSLRSCVFESFCFRHHHSTMNGVVGKGHWVGKRAVDEMLDTSLDGCIDNKFAEVSFCRAARLIVRLRKR